MATTSKFRFFYADTSATEDNRGETHYASTVESIYEQTSSQFSVIIMDLASKIFQSRRQDLAQNLFREIVFNNDL